MQNSYASLRGSLVISNLLSDYMILQLRTEQEKKIIELEHELLSAKLRAEHAHLELPRLRTRVNELQAYTDVLKPASTGNLLTEWGGGGGITG